MKTKKILLLLVAVICILPALNAQTFTHSYNTAPIYPGGQTDVVRIIETYDRGYVILSNGTDAVGNGNSNITKYNKTGQQVFSFTLRHLTLPVYNIKGLCLTENRDGGHEIAIGGFFNDNGTARGFVTQLSSTGTHQWTQIWAGNPAKGLAYSPRPGMPGIYQLGMLHNELNNANGMQNLHIINFQVPAPGTRINSAFLTDQATVEAVDLVNIPARNTYGVVGNRNVTLPPGTLPHIIAYEVNHNLAAANGVALPVNLKVTVATRIMYDDAVSGGQHLHITGYRDGATKRPILLKINAATMGWTQYVEMNGTLTPGTSLVGTGLGIIKKSGSTGVMVSCYSENGAVYEPYVYTANNSMATQNFYLHTPLTGKKYVDVTSTFDPEMYMIAGRDMSASIEALTRATYKGQACGSSQAFADVSLSPTPADVDFINSDVFNPVATNFLSAGFGNLSAATTCGCNIPTDVGSTYYNRAINMGSYTFGSWSKNQTAFNTTNEDAVMGITAIDAGANKMLLAHITPDGIWDFGKLYTTANATHEVRAVKELGNKDYAIAGVAKVTSTGKQHLYLMRVDPTGNVIWYRRISITDMCSNCTSSWVCEILGLRFNHVYIAEMSGTAKDLVIAADVKLWDNTGSYAVARFTSAGSLTYYRNHQPYAASYDINLTSPDRGQVELNGITATNDNGYAICGSTGNGTVDWNGAIVVKFDGGFISTHTRDWYRVFRKNMAVYDLSVTTKSAYAVANDIKTDASGNLIVVGFENNMNVYYKDETYTDGLLLKYSSTGTLLLSKHYHSNTSEIVFSGVTVNSAGNYAVTGKFGGVFRRNDAPYDHRSFFAIIDAGTTNLNGKIYGLFTGATELNDLNTTFQTSNGYRVTGLSNDYSSTLLPSVMNVDGSGQTFECYEYNMSHNNEDITNNAPALDWHGYYSATTVTEEVTVTQPCLSLHVLCTPTPPEAMQHIEGTETGEGTKGTESGTNHQEPELQTNLLVYPNPTHDKLTVDITLTTDTKATVNMYDIQGKVVMKKTVQLSKGKNTVQLDVAELKESLYIIQVEDSDKTIIATERFEKL